MSADLNKITTCTHSAFSHLFSNVFCPRQATSLKITKAVLGLFVVLGVAWKTYSYLCSDLSGRTSTRLPPADHSLKGQEALTYARHLLAQYPDIQSARLKQEPVNEEISKLVTLLWDVCWKEFEEAHKTNKVQPWAQRTVREAADNCMKVAYAISCLTLEDLQAFNERNKNDSPRVNAESLKRVGAQCTSDEASFIDALTRQDSYQYRTYFYCTQMYHSLRGGIAWSAPPWNDQKPAGLYLPKDPVDSTHFQDYYTQGTLQNSWNQLYNEFCDHVEMYVPLEALKKGDKRFFTWIKKDTGPQSFKAVPDTLPT